MFDRSHFSSIESFFGTEWLEDGAQRVQRAVQDMLRSGHVTVDIERREHPLHQLWYKYVLGGSLPSDWIRSRDGTVDQMLRQAHRILTLEYLIDSLASEWDDHVADDVRVKLMNTGQFSSALYELEVVTTSRNLE
jgi:hypothetical protein